MRPADQYLSLVLQLEFDQGRSMNKSEFAVLRLDRGDNRSLGSSAKLAEVTVALETQQIGFTF